ncbi:MAG: M13 family metallopeptidase [Oscillospiraceae bacterium]|nr:M13 family metallopeptidase [Oscillospiraceae bacterium]
MKKKGISLLLAAVLLLTPGLPATAAETVEPYGEPWLTSIVDGMVTAELPKPDLKDDFFLYNNYEWLCDTALKPSHFMGGGVFDLEDLVDEQIATLFTDESLTGREADLVREFYQMILDWENRAEGKAFFLEHLKKIQDIETLADLTAYLTGEDAKGYGPDLGGPIIGAHPEHPDEWMVSFGWTALSRWGSEEYGNETPAGARTGKYHDDEASYALQYAGFSEAEAAEIVRQAYEFEAMIAPSVLTEEEQAAGDAVLRMYNLCTREELAAASPNFPILAILDSYAFNPELEINLAMPAWLEKINELYTEENVPLMRAYLLYWKASEELQFLDEACYREYQKLTMEFLGTEESEDDETVAKGLVQTWLPQFVDEMYVQKYTSDKTRENILGAMREIIAEYREMLAGETWLTEATREEAIKKLDAMALNAVYPESRDDWSVYTFTSRSEGGSLLQAYEELRRSKIELERMKSYGKPDPKVWVGDQSFSVNASYRAENNSINIFAGILNGDVYRDDMTREEMLAGIGNVIAHEISHAFDLSGSQYDENGVLRNWWTDADRAEFERRGEKVVAYYNSLHPWKDGAPYSGAVVQQEAIADLGGMACLLRIAEKTEDFDYDAFFTAYAKHWRCKFTEVGMENSYRNNNHHPLNHLRVNVVLAQFPKFQETYGIQPGDGMYVAPEDRIGIWGMNE